MPIPSSASLIKFLLLTTEVEKLSALNVPPSFKRADNTENFCWIPPGQSSSSVPPVTGRGMSTKPILVLVELDLCRFKIPVATSFIMISIVEGVSSKSSPLLLRATIEIRVPESGYVVRMTRKEITLTKF